MLSLGDILKLKTSNFNDAVLNLNNSKRYNSSWNDGVYKFLLNINEERKKDGLEPVTFIAVRQKLVGIKEIDDLRWFFYVCKKYSKTKDKQGNQNTFSKAFWGALRFPQK